MNNKYPIIQLAKGKEHSVKRFHPWIFSGAIKKMEEGIREGDVVKVVSSNNEVLGIGHFQHGSIAVRLLSFKDENINQTFWEEKISSAYQERIYTGIANNKNLNVYRLVFAEGDNLPGLIIDMYNGTAVIQAHSIGMYNELQEITNALKNVLKDNLIAVYDKSKETLPSPFSDSINNRYLLGNAVTNEVNEYGNKFKIDWINGQKTGFFIDQRENRKLLGEYSKNKKVLNTFCYTGGFSIYALNAGATLVHSVDISEKAIQLTDENVALNNFSNHKSFAVDVFDFLKNADKDYDVIVLDPPAFAKSRKVSHNAVQGYKRINSMAMKKIKKGGILFTFSCSQAINRTLFYNTVISAAIESGRKIRVIHHLSQPADHPVNIYHPEGEYLKGLVLYVE
ncbi:MAG: class I SAM-dependent rRNA methyltransferase [Bacteroidia bacterium]